MLGRVTGCVVVAVPATEEPCDVGAAVPINGFDRVGVGVGVGVGGGIGANGIATPPGSIMTPLTRPSASPRPPSVTRMVITVPFSLAMGIWNQPLIGSYFQYCIFAGGAAGYVMVKVAVAPGVILSTAQFIRPWGKVTPDGGFGKVCTLIAERPVSMPISLCNVSVPVPVAVGIPPGTPEVVKLNSFPYSMVLSHITAFAR